MAQSAMAENVTNGLGNGTIVEGDGAWEALAQVRRSI